jgi:hypothetical protein
MFKAAFGTKFSLTERRRVMEQVREGEGTPSSEIRLAPKVILPDHVDPLLKQGEDQMGIKRSAKLGAAITGFFNRCRRKTALPQP